MDPKRYERLGWFNRWRFSHHFEEAGHHLLMVYAADTGGFDLFELDAAVAWAELGTPLRMELGVEYVHLTAEQATDLAERMLRQGVKVITARADGDPDVMAGHTDAFKAIAARAA
jgi:hypothetical protein